MKKVTTKKIALFVPNLAAGGAERVMLQLASGFSEFGFDIDFVMVNAEGQYMSDIPESVNIVDLSSTNSYTSIPKLYAYLHKEKPTVLLSTLDLTNLIAILVNKVSKVPTTVVIRVANTVSIQKRSFIKKKLEQLLLTYIYPWANQIVSVSQGVAQDLTHYTGIQPESIKTIYNPVRIPELRIRANEQLEHTCILNCDIPIILGVGRLTNQKDFPTLIRAFALIRKKRRAMLIILGDGEERSKLESLIDKLNIATDVYMPGYVNNPYPYLKRSSVFVLSSKWEGMPNVMLEALACGCPVVSTNCPSGPREILAEEKYGHLAPVGDYQAIAQAIEQVLEGDKRKPPEDWFIQFEYEHVIRQYLAVMGLSTTG